MNQHQHSRGNNHLNSIKMTSEGQPQQQQPQQQQQQQQPSSSVSQPQQTTTTTSQPQAPSVHPSYSSSTSSSQNYNSYTNPNLSYADPTVLSIPNMIAAKQPPPTTQGRVVRQSYQQQYPNPYNMPHPGGLVSNSSDNRSVSMASFASSGDPQVSSLSSLSMTGKYAIHQPAAVKGSSPVSSQSKPTTSSRSSATTTTSLGGVSIPALSGNIPTAMQVQVAAAAAAAAAAPPRLSNKSNQKNKLEQKKSSDSSSSVSRAEKQKLNRDRNRDHARATRLRKKAYVNKLKELVEGLHAERSEEARKRRVAVQHLAEVQTVRRNVIRYFLQYHSSYEPDPRKWATILEENFFLKQPITPYRSFRRVEIEQECRKSRGLDAVVADAASMAAMIDSIGCRSTRWMHIKREDFLMREESRNGTRNMPRSIVHRSSRSQPAVSSLSSSSGSSLGNGEDDNNNNNTNTNTNNTTDNNNNNNNNNKPSTKSLSSSNNNNNNNNNKASSSNDFHDYHAQPLPDPRLDSGEGSAGSDSVTSDHAVAGIRGKHVCTDSSSDEDEKQPTRKKPRMTSNGPNMIVDKASGSSISTTVNERLSTAPVVSLPPFVGIGKRAAAVAAESSKPAIIHPNKENSSATLSGSGATIIAADNDTASSDSSDQRRYPQIQASYHINEDDMLLTDDVLMCPFIFRSQDAVINGALAECIMPGMLRAHFSPRNKIFNVEMVYDAMGFMQQLERASGSEGTAQIIPNSLDMALQPTASEARAITLAKPPFRLVSVNEPWTRITKYSQMEVEGNSLTILHGKRTDPDAGKRPNKPLHDFHENARGLSACSVNVYYDKHQRDFIAYVSTYPLTNANDEITHLLHVWKKLEVPHTPEVEYPDTGPSNSSLSFHQQ